MRNPLLLKLQEQFDILDNKNTPVRLFLYELFQVFGTNYIDQSKFGDKFNGRFI